MSAGRLRGPLALAAKAGVTAGLLWWLAQSLDLAEAGRRIAGLDPGWAAAALAAMAIQVPLAGLRWRAVMVAVGAPLPVPAMLRLTAIGFFFNQTLPSAIGGDAVRVWLARREGAQWIVAVSGVLMDRAVGLLVMAAAILAGLPGLARLGVSAATVSSLAAAAGAAVGGTVLLALAGPLAAAMLGRWRITRPLAAMAGDLRRVLGRPGRASAICLLSAVILLANVAGIFLLARSVGAEPSFAACLVLVPVVLMVAVLPISLAGWGVRETAMVTAFAHAGVDSEAALATSILFGLALVVLGLPGGILWLISGRRRAAAAAGPQTSRSIGR